MVVLTGEGELLTAEASPEGFKEISRVHVLGGKCWINPVLSEKRLFCRNAQGDLIALDVNP